MQHIHSESYEVALERFRSHVLSMPKRSFSRPLTEREWCVVNLPTRFLFDVWPLG